MLTPIIRQHRLALFQLLWREKNKHNNTTAISVFNIENVEVGIGTYGYLNIASYSDDKECLRIGNFCSIALDTIFILGGEHNFKQFSTFPLRHYYVDKRKESFTKGPIVIQDDVWIGYGCKILSGVKIGQGAIIGAGTIVTKDVPPYAIFAGNRVIGYRFNEAQISKLLLIDFSKLTDGTIKEYRDYISLDIDAFLSSPLYNTLKY